MLCKDDQTGTEASQESGEERGWGCGQKPSISNLFD